MKIDLSGKVALVTASTAGIVTKTAQLSLARGLAKFVAGSGVTVNSVLPGPTISDGFAEMMKDEVAKTGKPLDQLAKEFVMTHRPSSVIQRAASVDEVANMVVYVCSTQASATSGAALRVDGGVVSVSILISRTTGIRSTIAFTSHAAGTNEAEKPCGTEIDGRFKYFSTSPLVRSAITIVIMQLIPAANIPSHRLSVIIVTSEPVNA